MPDAPRLASMESCPLFVALIVILTASPSPFLLPVPSVLPTRHYDLNRASAPCTRRTTCIFSKARVTRRIASRRTMLGRWGTTTLPGSTALRDIRRHARVPMRSMMLRKLRIHAVRREFLHCSFPLPAMFCSGLLAKMHTPCRPLQTIFWDCLSGGGGRMEGPVPRLDDSRATTPVPKIDSENNKRKIRPSFGFVSV